MDGRSVARGSSQGDDTIRGEAGKDRISAGQGTLSFKPPWWHVPYGHWASSGRAFPAISVAEYAQTTGRLVSPAAG